MQLENLYNTCGADLAFEMGIRRSGTNTLVFRHPHVNGILLKKNCHSSHGRQIRGQRPAASEV